MEKDKPKIGDTRQFELDCGVVTARYDRNGDDLHGWVIELLVRKDGSLVHVGEAGHGVTPSERVMRQIASGVIKGTWRGWERFIYRRQDILDEELSIMKNLVLEAKAQGLGKTDAQPREFEPQADGSLLVRYRVGHLSAEMRVERGDWRESKRRAIAH
jgi:hypothetical protein